MATWTNRHWGALIGGLLVVLISLLGVGITALVVLFGILGYFVGRYLDGDLDLEEIRARAQGRYDGPSEPVEPSYQRRPPV